MFCKCRLWADGRDFGGTPDGTGVPDCSVLQRSQLIWNWLNISCCLWNCLWLVVVVSSGLDDLRSFVNTRCTGWGAHLFGVFGLSIVYWYGVNLNRARQKPFFLYVVQHKHKREYSHLISLPPPPNKRIKILKISFVKYTISLCKIMLTLIEYISGTIQKLPIPS